MKTKWLAALLVILSLLLIVPVISSCSCGDDTTDGSTPGTDISTPSSEGTADSTPDSGDTENSTPGSTPDSTPGSTPESTPGSDNPTIPSVPDIPVGELPTGQVAPVVKYLRVANIGSSDIVVKFNSIGKNVTYEIRYSDSEITAENFANATLANVEVLTNGEIRSATLDLTVGKTQKYYIAVQATSNGVKSTVETVRAGGVEPVFLDPNRITSVYCGEVIKNLSPLIDEFEGIVDPLNQNPGTLPTNRLGKFYYKAGDYYEGALDPVKDTHERYGTDLAPILDLEYTHYVQCIMVYYSHETYDLDVRSSKDFASFNNPDTWDGTNVSYLKTDFKSNDWNLIPIDKEVRFIQLQFLDGEAPVEVVVYGYQTGETVGDEIGTTQHKLPTIGELMGACGLLGDGAYCSVEDLECCTVLREYHNFGWSYNYSSFPKKATTLIKTNVGNFDKKYADHYLYNLVVPCLQWNDDSNPARVYDKLTGKLSATVASFTQKYLPSTYIAYADLMFQYAARYGSTKVGYLYDVVREHSDGGDKVGLNYIKWLEFGNEPNGEDQRGTTPYQLAALTSCAYDGHMRTVLADVYNPDDFSYFLGAKNADPDIKVAMAGLAGIGDGYITAMCYWMRAERYDKYNQWTTKNDAIAMDAFNVHTYFGEYYTLNGQQIIVGVSPEEWGLVDGLSALVEFRDRYYPEVEIWLTEFGWDTNESYETMTSSHRYGPYTSRQVQAMWLTRAYLLLSAMGVDKATMYMLEDAGGANDKTSIGKYGTCGVIANRFTADNKYRIYIDGQGREAIHTKYEIWEAGEIKEKEGYYYIDKDGNLVEPANHRNFTYATEYKEGYYYMCTLLNTLRDFTFRRELVTGDDRVWAYQYSDVAGNEAYAVWCPTSNVTKVDNYKLYVGKDCKSVVLTETDAPNQSKTGVKTNLTVDKDGFVSINVSENPVYVVVTK